MSPLLPAPVLALAGGLAATVTTLPVQTTFVITDPALLPTLVLSTLVALVPIAPLDALTLALLSVEVKSTPVATFAPLLIAPSLGLSLLVFATLDLALAFPLAAFVMERMMYVVEFVPLMPPCSAGEGTLCL